MAIGAGRLREKNSRSKPAVAPYAHFSKNRFGRTCFRTSVDEEFNRGLRGGHWIGEGRKSETRSNNQIAEMIKTGGCFEFGSALRRKSDRRAELVVLRGFFPIRVIRVIRG